MTGRVRRIALSHRPFVVALTLWTMVVFAACSGSSPSEPEPAGSLQAEIFIGLPSGVTLEMVTIRLDGSTIFLQALLPLGIGNTYLAFAAADDVRLGRHELEVRIDRMSSSPHPVSIEPIIEFQGPDDAEPRQVFRAREAEMLANGEGVRFAFDI